MKGPDFIGIGAQKSATSFVYEALRRHPQIGFPATRERLKAPSIELDGRSVITWPKEIQFLNGPNSGMSWDEYLALFDGNLPDRLYGEISPAYLVAPIDRIRELRERVEGVLLFAILRDPVERDWSAVRMIAERRGLLDDPRGLYEIASWQQIRDHGNYVEHLSNWLRVFPPDQLLILPYELLKRDSLEFLAAICGYLGVPVDPIANRADTIVYEGPQAPLPDGLRELLVSRHRGVLEELSALCGSDFSEYWSPELRRQTVER